MKQKLTIYYRMAINLAKNIGHFLVKENDKLNLWAGIDTD